MNVPSYQFIKTFSLPDLESELSRAHFLKNPYIIYIKEIEDEESAIELIETILKSKKFNGLPYPVYIITNVQKYHANLLLLKKIEDAPAFYMRKYRQPNLKEQNLLKKNLLLLEKFRFIDIKRATENLQDYSKKQRHLSVLAKEGYFLEGILLKLEDMDG